MGEEVPQNRRLHVRFGLHVPLYADLYLHRVGDREITSRTLKVLLDNISYGGCLFRTHLQIPPRPDVTWMLKLRLGQSTMRLKGIIVRGQAEEGYSLYGVTWKLSAYESQIFRYRLNEYLQATYVFAPHIQTLYRKIAERSEDSRFKRLDFTT